MTTEQKKVVRKFTKWCNFYFFSFDNIERLQKCMKLYRERPNVPTNHIVILQAMYDSIGYANFVVAMRLSIPPKYEYTKILKEVNKRLKTYEGCKMNVVRSKSLMTYDLISTSSNIVKHFVSESEITQYLYAFNDGLIYAGIGE